VPALGAARQGQDLRSAVDQQIDLLRLFHHDTPNSSST
jgi:hypothetical protein